MGVNIDQKRRRGDDLRRRKLGGDCFGDWKNGMVLVTEIMGRIGLKIEK